MAEINNFEGNDEEVENEWISTAFATEYQDINSDTGYSKDDVIGSDGNLETCSPINDKTRTSDDFIDVNDLVEDSLADTLQKTNFSKTSNVLKTRSYTLSIVYDKYYQTPRIYLEGFDANNHPLDNDQVFEDIMQDYQNKTVTFEKHPHLNTKSLQASIHPCRHAKVMKKIIDRLRGQPEDSSETGKTESSVHVKDYIFIFLKFIQSVIPTVDYDYTIEIRAK